MDYNTLFDLAVSIGHRLATSGAETYRVEDSIALIMQAYDVKAEVFAIPNCLIVTMQPPYGMPMTRMIRVAHHGNNLDSVERYSNLSRRICKETPAPHEAMQWLQNTDASRQNYNMLMQHLGNFLIGCGFGYFYGSTFLDCLLTGLCSTLVGLITKAMDSLKANDFFRTVVAAFVMAVAAYALSVFRVVENSDTVIIGALMLLVPGLLFTNAMRDAIYGDTNSGLNRMVSVFLIAAAIASGTAAAWQVINTFIAQPISQSAQVHSLPEQLIASLVACIGFSIYFNIHGAGFILCALGGVLSWATYCVVMLLGGSDLAGYFWAAVVSAVYSEVMARLRKYPAISYLVISILPLIPGSYVYYTMTYALKNDISGFAEMGIYTVAIAGVIALGILMVSTAFRIWAVWKRNRTKK